MSLRPIDTSFDLETEPNCTLNPDRRSPTLQRYQRLLFSQPLPTDATFTLAENTSGLDRVLRYESEAASFDLSSDTILKCTHLHLEIQARGCDEEHDVGHDDFIRVRPAIRRV
ncbi:MAG: hypothetical protein JWM51_797 [Microbacteriaceae bacterium]|nr:hypothetical protein [Microbacteriaceae bacterium]